MKKGLMFHSISSLLVLLAAIVVSATGNNASPQHRQQHQHFASLKLSTQKALLNIHGGDKQGPTRRASSSPPPSPSRKGSAKSSSSSASSSTSSQGVAIPNEVFSIIKAIVGVGVVKIVASQKAAADRKKVSTTNAPIVSKGSTTTTSSSSNAPATITNPEGASIPNEVFNLVKAIVGVGVLSLPSGIAAFADAKSAFLPAGTMIAIIGILSGYGFALIGKVCAYTGARSYREAWAKSVGPGTAWIPAWSATFKTSAACLAYSMVLGDTFSSIFKTSRNPTLIGMTLMILLPLCLMKNLKSLAPFSLLGVMGMAYTALAMTVRWLDGSYGVGGSLVADVAESLRPLFGSNGGFESVLNPSSLILLCMLSTAYMAHFNAPKFYLELKDNTIPRFNAVVSWSFGISILLMGYITMTGFLTFGKSCSGLILNNYSSNDLWIAASRVAVAISLVFSYPLAFVGMREGIIDLMKVPTEKRSNSSYVNTLTVILLSLLTFLACTLKNVGFVLAFGGATLGNALTYVYPALMYTAINKKQNRNENVAVFASQVSAVLGIVMGVIGANMALKKR